MSLLSCTLVGFPLPFGTNLGLTFNTFAQDATTDTIEWIFQAREAATITTLGFRYGARTGTPPTYRISLQGVDASGLPDGTIKSSANAYATFTPPATTAWNSLWQWIALGSSYTCARGEWLAIVIDYSTGTVDGSNFSSFTTDLGGFTTRVAVPYVIQNNAGSRTRAAACPCYGYQSASTTYGTVVQAVYTTTISSPNEQALAFSLPSGGGTTYQVVGAELLITTPAAGTTWNLTLYDGTSALQAVTVDSDVVRVAATGNCLARIYFDEESLSNLAYGTTYYLALTPNEGTTAIGLNGVTAASAQDIQSLGGGGAFYLATRAGAAWTAVPATRPLAGLLVEDMTASGGGNVTFYMPAE